MKQKADMKPKADTRRKANRRKRIMAVLLLCLFTGCGRPAAEEPADIPSDASPAGETFNWREETIMPPTDVIKGNFLNVTEYYPYTTFETSDTTGSGSDTADFSYNYFSSWGADFYNYVSVPYNSENDSAINTRSDLGKDLLFTVQGDSRQMSWQEIPHTEDQFLTVFDNKLVYLSTEFDKDEETGQFTPLHLYVTYRDLEGNVLDQADLLKGYMELGFAERSSETPYYPRSCIPEAGGYYYILDLQSTALYGMDDQGNTKTVLDFTDQRQALIRKGYAFDGSPLFANWNFNTKATDIYTVDHGNARVFASLPMIRVTNFYLGGTGLCYLIGDDHILYCYDLKTGNLSQCYDLKAGGITEDEQLIISADQKGDILLYTTGISLERALLVLSDRQPEKSISLTLLDARNDTYLQGCAAGFSRRNPGVNISVETISYENEQQYEQDMEKLAVELAAGKGPDIMCIDQNTMRFFWEKGLLMDLTEMVSAETAEQIFPIVMESGKADDRQAGIALGGYVNSLGISGKYWDKDHISIMELLSLIEENQDDCKGVAATYMNPSPEQFLWMLTTDMAHSPFIDLDAGVSHFDSPDFVHALEVIKNCKRQNEDWDTMLSLFAEGEYLVFDSLYIHDFHSFSQVTARLGGNAILAGVPTESECGLFYTPYSIMAVNASCEYKEIIQGFTEYVLSRECQRSNYTNVIREDILREYTHYNAQERESSFYIGDGHYLILDSKPDGSSYLEEYISFMKRCVPYPYEPEGLSNIIQEEAESYFNGDRSAREAAEIIHNRVTLFLKEQK